MKASEYKKLKDEFSALPDFKAADAVLRLHLVEDATLEAIKKHCKSEMDPVVSLMLGILQPDTHSFAEMSEYNCLDAQEKETILGMYKQLMVFEKEFFISDLENNREKDVACIKHFVDAWKDIKTQILPFVVKLKDHWNGSALAKKAEYITYMG